MWRWSEGQPYLRKKKAIIKISEKTINWLFLLIRFKYRTYRGKDRNTGIPLGIVVSTKWIASKFIKCWYIVTVLLYQGIVQHITFKFSCYNNILMGIFVHFCVTLLNKLFLLLFFFLICSVWLLKSYTILELIKLYLTLEVFCILNFKILGCFWFTMFLISLESVIPHIIAYRDIGLESNLIKIHVWIILILHDQFSFMERRCPMKVSRRIILQFPMCFAVFRISR